MWMDSPWINPADFVLWLSIGCLCGWFARRKFERTLREAALPEEFSKLRKDLGVASAPPETVIECRSEVNIYARELRKIVAELGVEGAALKSAREQLAAERGVSLN